LSSQIWENFQNQDGGRAFFREGLVPEFWAFFKKHTRLFKNLLSIFPNLFPTYKLEGKRKHFDCENLVLALFILCSLHFYSNSTWWIYKGIFIFNLDTGDVTKHSFYRSRFMVYSLPLQRSHTRTHVHLTSSRLFIGSCLWQNLFKGCVTLWNTKSQALSYKNNTMLQPINETI
jgi:hypothetical protein